MDLQGHVWLNRENGPGLENVAIYRSYTHYPGQLVATTGQDGYYQADFMYISGDETVQVWPELTGYTFNPEMYRWHHYSHYESKTLNFIAIPNVYLPVVRRSSGAVRSATHAVAPARESQ